MKLYIYDHCPFCTRVRFAASALSITLEEIVVDYDDQKTLVDLIGKKMVPVLVKEDGTAMAESLDIISYFIERSQSHENDVPSASVIHWQSRMIPLVVRIGYPRWSTLGLAEFQTAGSRETWRTNKETDELNFDRLLEETDGVVQDLAGILPETISMLNLLGGVSQLPLVDQAIIFSMLRGLRCETTLHWPSDLIGWLEQQAVEKHLPLI